MYNEASLYQFIYLHIYEILIFVDVHWSLDDDGDLKTYGAG